MKNSSEKAVIKYNIDNNYGLGENYMITQIYNYGVTNTDSDNNNKVRLIFPRVILLNKEWSSHKIHKVVFEYFYPQIYQVLKQKINEEEGLKNLSEIIDDIDKLFDYFYTDYETTPDTLNNQYYLKKNIPFRLYMNTHIHNKEKVNVFNNQSTNIDDGYVLFPKDESVLDDYIRMIPCNQEGQYIDNSFLFMNEHNKFYSNLTNRDFYLQAVWNLDYCPGIKNLNDKVDFDFKIARKQKESIDLDECFKHFCKEEQLEENNKWYCGTCKEHVMAKVHMELYSTPAVMIIHLKRFKGNHKIDTLVDFPLKGLDMNKYIRGEQKNKENKYDLFGVAHHYGGMGGGHYVASCQNYFNKKWYNFNDSSVTSETPEDVVSSSAYVLFYKRQDIGDINFEEIYNKKFVNYNPPEEKK
jgi:hypothetical protein